MGLIASIYDTNENGAEGRLLYWLKLDTWSLKQAAMIITNIDPDHAFVDQNFNFSSLKSF